VFRTVSVAAVLGLTVAAAPVHAQDNYVSLSGGAAWLNDSDNEGDFTGPFTTGAGTTIPAGTGLPSGAAVGWETEFDTGFTVSGAVGRKYGNARAELEVAYQKNDIDTHSNVSAAGIALGAEDAGVLVTGATSNLGVSVANLVADGRGEVETIYLMANAYYDFAIDSKLTPYLGAGLGVGFVDVNYAPSGVTIIDDDDTVLAYQVMAGVSYDVSEAIALFAGYKYRATTNVDVDATLFAADFDIENGSQIVEVGLRFSF